MKFELDDKRNLMKIIRESEDEVDIVIPDNVNWIHRNAFSGDSNIEKITISDGVSLLGKGCFMNCKNLEEIIIADTVKDINQGAFCQCVNLKRIDLPSKLTNIYENTFERCVSLEKIRIPDNVKYIGYRAFADCSSLENLELPPACVFLIRYGGSVNIKSIDLSGNFLKISMQSACIILFRYFSILLHPSLNQKYYHFLHRHLT